MSEPDVLKTIAQATAGLAAGAPVEASFAGGIVTLTGEVPDEARSRAIEQGLLQLPAVDDVRNQLRIAAPRGEPRAQLTALLAREGVRLASLQVEARDGALTLLGRAEAWFDRDAAERLAWTLPGVRSVDNRIVLAEGAVTPDSESGEGLPA